MKLKLTKPKIDKLVKQLQKDGVVAWEDDHGLKQKLQLAFPDAIITSAPAITRGTIQDIASSKLIAMAIRLKEPKNGKAKKEKKAPEVAGNSLQG